MKFELEGKKDAKVLRWGLELDYSRGEDADLNLLANGNLVLWIKPDGEVHVMSSAIDCKLDLNDFYRRR